MRVDTLEGAQIDLTQAPGTQDVGAQEAGTTDASTLNVSKPDTVGKATRLLTLLSEVPDGATLMALSRASGLPPSSAHRLLASLRREALVDFEPASRRYSLGLALFQMGAAVAAARGFDGAALPVLREITGVTDESTLLSVLDGPEQLCVHHVQADVTVGVRGEAGTRAPLHATAAGKVLLALSGPDTRRALLDRMVLTALTPRTISTREGLVTELDEVRRQGFAVADEESEMGVRAIAVPVLGPGGRLLGALTTSCPAYRTTVPKAQRFLEPLQAGARKLSVLLPDR